MREDRNSPYSQLSALKSDPPVKVPGKTLHTLSTWLRAAAGGAVETCQFPVMASNTRVMLHSASLSIAPVPYADVVPDMPSPSAKAITAIRPPPSGCPFHVLHRQERLVQ